MERLNWHLAEQLARFGEVRVIGPQGAVTQAPAGVIVREAPLSPLPGFLFHAAQLARNEARTWRPDVVIAGSGLTAPLSWWAARACGARTAAYVHGLDIVVPHPVYRALWRPALRRMERIIANSAPTARLALGIGIAPARIGIVHPGVDLPMPDAAARARFRQRWGIAPETPVLLSVGRLTERKGLREFVRDVLPIIAQAWPDVVLVIVGDAPTQALYAQAQSPQSILETAHAAGVADHVRLLGPLFERDLLTDSYFGADVHVFPVRELPDDPEGFGMVAIEAAAHGLPTVAYATGGVVDAVAEGVSGRLVPPGDAKAFAAAVLHTLDAPPLANACCAFAQGFAWEVFGQRLARELST
ncbi:glycosyltransferase family 4 protein [Caldichromatium japonicum]|uniref:Glycosyltransferase family 4 protein n=2 Tax=Caldichromatium japonicum TaxID=2699430 RepID=A0A6G7VHC2_9GAMM|nr:glycosyltransferase family 4 protein [Caldichromatium japonicum]